MSQVAFDSYNELHDLDLIACTTNEERARKAANRFIVMLYDLKMKDRKRNGNITKMRIKVSGNTMYKSVNLGEF